MSQHWIATRPGDLDVFSYVDEHVPAPGPAEVTIDVRAAGMNPADVKFVAHGDPADFPKSIGYEVAGVVSAAGPDAGFAVGDEVVAFRISGGWAEQVTVSAADVFAKPASVSFEAAANLLLVGTTAAEMLHVTGVRSGETILVHGASGAVGLSVLQQAALIGARVIGTAGEARSGEVRRFGGVPVAYGDGLLDRVREAAPEGVVAALDCVGTDEAVETSLALVDRSRIVTIAAFHRAEADGIAAIGGGQPDSEAFRAQARAGLVRLAGEGRLEVPVAASYPMAEAMQAVERLLTGHPGGKLALVP